QRQLQRSKDAYCCNSFCLPCARALFSLVTSQTPTRLRSPDRYSRSVSPKGLGERNKAARKLSGLRRDIRLSGNIWRSHATRHYVVERLSKRAVHRQI